MCGGSGGCAELGGEGFDVGAVVQVRASRGVTDTEGGSDLARRHPADQGGPVDVEDLRRIGATYEAVG